MSTPLGDVLGALREILDLLEDGDCAITPTPCRTNIYLGGEVPWDTCGDGGCSDKDGMLWAKLVSIDPTTGTDQGKCATYNLTAEIGVVRSIASATERNPIPPGDKVEADAVQQAADADAIFSALRCCEARTEAVRDLVLASWSPLGPSGKCAGGAWIVRGGLSVCC